MKTSFYGTLVLSLAIFVALASAQAQQPATEVAPHALDGAFKGNTVKEFNEGLLNNELYKRAVKEALKAKNDAENRKPNIVGPSPARAARIRFFEVLYGKDEK